MIKMPNAKKNRKLIAYITDGKRAFKVLAKNIHIKAKNVGATFGFDVKEVITSDSFTIKEIKNKKKIKELNK